jgi:hypothetical protein
MTIGRRECQAIFHPPTWWASLREPACEFRVGRVGFLQAKWPAPDVKTNRGFMQNQRTVRQRLLAIAAIVVVTKGPVEVLVIDHVEKPSED